MHAMLDVSLIKRTELVSWKNLTTVLKKFIFERLIWGLTNLSKWVNQILQTRKIKFQSKLKQSIFLLL